MGRIRILEQAVADRIAAGEVVERPASVVKELVENSLDAGATRITVEVAGAGSALIRVDDDGCGMDADDLHLAVRRFATSKIATADDLRDIRSFGFRGEALPSIASVSHLELTSAPAGSPARRLRLVGGEVVGEQTVGAPPGTTVVVAQLFFNTPARRKFLKSPGREFALIVDALNRLALAHPQVAFRLIHEGDEVLHYPAGAPDDRAADVFGRDVFDRMLPLAERAGEVELSGWLGRPELARASRRQQYLFVNRRPVHSRMLNGAVEQAYHQLLPTGRHPIFAVFVAVPARRVDVNIHPRKLDVRFDDEHQMFGVVARAVRAALRAAPLLRTVSPAGPAAAGAAAGRPAPTAPVLPSATEPAAAPGTLLVAEPQFTAAAPPVEVPASARLPAMRLLGQLHGTYLLAQSEHGLVVIDQHAAHERVLFERLRAAAAGTAGPGGAAGRMLVAPVAVALSADEHRLLADYRQALADLGFALEPFGDSTVLIRALPEVAAGLAPERVLRDVLAHLADGGRPSALDELVDRAAIATACHTAVRAGDRLSVEQMAALLADLARTADPFTCFHGRPTMVTVPLAAVERWFFRR